MASGPNDFKDPKVRRSNTPSNGGGMGKWIGILVGIVILLLLGWMLGWFANTDADMATVPAEGSTHSDGTVPAVDRDISVDQPSAPANN